MPLEPLQNIPPIEISPITEQELQKIGAAKLLYRRVTELENEMIALRGQLETERARREQATTERYTIDARRQVLEQRLSSMSYRNAVSQIMWGAAAILAGLDIDFGRSRKWGDLGFSLTATVLIIVAVYLINSNPRTTTDSELNGTRYGQQ